MPTGYTAAVQDGTITTLHDYAMTCARAFGALIHMRDDPADAPIPGRIEPSPWYAENLKTSRARLAELERMSPSEAQRQCQQEHSSQMARWRDRREQAVAHRARYTSMLQQVMQWTPPTPDHTGLRSFMCGQLKDSLDFDCYSEGLPQPKLQRWPDWLRDKTTEAKAMVKAYAEKASEEQERAASRTAWLQALRDSLRGDAS